MNRLGKFGIITVIIIFATLLLIGCTFSYTLDSEAAEQLFGPGSDFHEKMDETFGDGGTLDNIFGRGGEFERALYSKNLSKAGLIISAAVNFSANPRISKIFISKTAINI